MINWIISIFIWIVYETYKKHFSILQNAKIYIWNQKMIDLTLKDLSLILTKQFVSAHIDGANYNIL